jgi:hypothetical protein
MSIGYSVLILIHILLFVYWLGGDLGVFYGSGFVRNPAYSVETRRTVMKVVHFVDLFPRMALVTMVAVGSSLAVFGGYTVVPDGLQIPALIVIWVLDLSWLYLVIKIYGGPAGFLTRVDYFIRYSVIALLLGFGVASLLGFGPVSPGAHWLAVKLIVFACIISCGLGIRWAIKPFGPAYAKLMATGSTPEIEATLTASSIVAKRFVVTLWIGLVIEAFLGISKFF